MVCSVLFLLPSLPRAPANRVLAASGTPVPGAFSAHAFGKLVPGAGVGAWWASVLDRAVHGHTPALASVVPVPGAQCRASATRASWRSGPCTPLGAAAHSPPRDQPCSFLSRLFWVCSLLEKQSFFSPRSSTSARTFALSGRRSPGWSFQPGRGIQPVLPFQHLGNKPSALSAANCRGV